MNTATTTATTAQSSPGGFGAWVRRTFGPATSRPATVQSTSTARPKSTPLEGETAKMALPSPEATTPPMAEVEAGAALEAPLVVDTSSEGDKASVKSGGALPTGIPENKLSRRKAPAGGRREFEPGSLTQLAALSALLRIESGRKLVIEDILKALLASPTAAESYAKELVRRFIEAAGTERRVNTVVGFGTIGTLFAASIARALEATYQDPEHQVSVLPVEANSQGKYSLAYAAPKQFVGGSVFIILAMPVIVSEDWSLITEIDTLIKSYQTTPSGLSRLVTVIQYETPMVEGEPARDHRLPVTRLMRTMFE